MQSSSVCPSCGGSGQSIILRGPGTDSNGMLNSEETVSINIPAGVEEGMQLKYQEKVMTLIIQMEFRRFLVLIEESSDNNFTREGKHLHYDLYKYI